MLSPASAKLRAALSVLFVFHLAMVVAYVWPWPEQVEVLEPISDHWLEVPNLRQKWNMFRNPGRSDSFMDHRGVLADGSEIEVLPSNEPPEGQFLRLRYARSVKAQNIVAYEKEPTRYRQHYAAWVCRQAPDEVVAVRLVKRRVKHLTMRDWVNKLDKERKVTETLLIEVPCTR